MPAFYNDHDAFCCFWVENLIRDGFLPPGVVDRRGIEELKADDLEGYEEVHLFSGVGTWAYALRLAGWDARTHGPVWSASCPCVPFSTAGKRKAEEDERHLWPEAHRLVRESLPRIIVGEQVASDLGYQWLAGVQADLEGCGYAFGAADLPACGVAAPHKRQRIFWGACRLADAPERGRRKGKRAGHPGRKQPDPVGGGEADRLADSTDVRLAGLSVIAGSLPSSEDEGRLCESERGGHVLVADADHDGRQGQGLHLQSGGSGEALPSAAGAGEVGVAQGDTNFPRPQGRVERGESASQLPSGQAGVPGEIGFWDESVPIHCADDRWRRVPAEPALFPLAPGPARALGGLRAWMDGLGYDDKATKGLFKRAGGCRKGLLKAVGNCIVPQIAATFIRAFLETVLETRKKSK